MTSLAADVDRGGRLRTTAESRVIARVRATLPVLRSMPAILYVEEGLIRLGARGREARSTGVRLSLVRAGGDNRPFNS